MTNKPKRIGTAAETAVVKYLRRNGFGSAERRALRGVLDAGDIAGLVGICVEVKGGKVAEASTDPDLARWLDETDIERHHGGADIGLLVTKRKAVGPANAGDWWAWLPGCEFVKLATGARWGAMRDNLPPVRITLAQAVLLLRAAGYGDPLTQEAQPA